MPLLLYKAVINGCGKRLVITVKEEALKKEAVESAPWCEIKGTERRVNSFL